MQHLSSEQRAALKQALVAAEKQTSARIAVATVPISDHYKLYPLVYGGLVGLAVLASLAFLCPHWPLRLAFSITLVASGLTTFLLDFWPLRLAVVPAHAKQWECWEVAHRAFASRVLAQNERKTGILLFVSLGERYVEVVTDRDVDRHIPQSVWDGLIQTFLAAARQGRAGEGLAEMVGAAAAVLAPHYPPG